MPSAVIVGFKRSPFAIARKGNLANVRPEDILSLYPRAYSGFFLMQ